MTSTTFALPIYCSHHWRSHVAGAGEYMSSPWSTSVSSALATSSVVAASAKASAKKIHNMTR
jgi:hypothetical protein